LSRRQAILQQHFCKYKSTTPNSHSQKGHKVIPEFPFHIIAAAKGITISLKANNPRQFGRGFSVY
jgi:hypothetical protein